MDINDRVTVYDAQQALAIAHPDAFYELQQWIYLGRILSRRARLVQLKLTKDFVIQVVSNS